MGARSAPTICSSHLTRWCLGTRLSRTMKTSSAALNTFGMRTGCDETFLGILLISYRRKLDLNGKEAVLHRFSRNEGADSARWRHDRQRAFFMARQHSMASAARARSSNWCPDNAPCASLQMPSLRIALQYYRDVLVGPDDSLHLP